jgi:hypothetical protein
MVMVLLRLMVAPVTGFGSNGGRSWLRVNHGFCC